ncbi:MAG: ABC transporter ATP-binding protein [Candidatus Lambdaproteobacteria bacterium]|nr:ABC transporter ATP-binding protein [Candidatus Lambdaproteobacteria bacterium]
MGSLLEVRNLKTRFYTQGREIHAVDGVSFDIQVGETLAIVGESGCGKSVTALSLLSLIPWPPGRIIDGEVWFLGENILDFDAERMRRIRGKEISMIFQEPMTSLNPILSIGRQLTETVMAHSDGGQRAAHARAVEMLAKVGIPEPARRMTQYPHQFSGGMRQRVMIAMALICSPKLILADEPTTALDVTIQAQILALMKALSVETGVSVVLITHNLGIVARYADRVNVMYAGRIVEQGVARAIYAHPRHPYTSGLIASVPRMNEPRGRQRLVPIEGQPPDLGALGAGCRFYPRCKYRREPCRTNDPPLREVEPGHWSACLLTDLEFDPAAGS